MVLILPQLPLEIAEAIADELVSLIINEDLNLRKAGIFFDNVARIMNFLLRLCGIQMPQTRDIISLRLACRKLRQKTFRVFARTCFGFLRTDLSARSIQRLKDIAAHDQIRKHVHTLHATLFLKEGESSYFGTGFTWNRGVHGRLVPPFPAFDAIREMLTSGLVNCRTFFIHKNLPSPFCTDEVSWDDIFNVFLSMIGDMKLHVKGFHRWKADDGGIHPARKLNQGRIHLENLRRPEFISVWSEHLEKLTLKCFEKDLELQFAGELVTTAKNLPKLDLRADLGENNHLLDDLIHAGLSPGLRDLRIRFYPQTKTLWSGSYATFAITYNMLLFIGLFAQRGIGAAYLRIWKVSSSSVSPFFRCAKTVDGSGSTRWWMMRRCILLHGETHGDKTRDFQV